MRKAQVIMGTGVTIDIPNAQGSAVFDTVFNRLKQIDRQFSTYKKNSEVSRYARGEVKWWRMSRDLRRVLKACKAAEFATDGVFSAWASGSFDPSGYVKGWAIDEAGRIIEKNGYQTYCISIGGDVLARGKKLWKIGIQDPKKRTSSLLTLKVKNNAVATSGNYIRGAHIINPKTGKSANNLASVTVVGPNIIDADVLATAAFVLGEFAINFIGGQAGGYDALTINKNNKLDSTPGLAKYTSF